MKNEILFYWLNFRRLFSAWKIFLIFLSHMNLVYGRVFAGTHVYVVSESLSVPISMKCLVQGDWGVEMEWGGGGSNDTDYLSLLDFGRWLTASFWLEQVTAGLNWLVRQASDVETNIVSVERLKEYSETPTEVSCTRSSSTSRSPYPSRVSFHSYPALRYVNCELYIPAFRHISEFFILATRSISDVLFYAFKCRKLSSLSICLNTLENFLTMLSYNYINEVVICAFKYVSKFLIHVLR